MARYSKTKRAEARRLYLTGEATTGAEIARRLHTKPHTIAEWKKEEDWDALRLKIDRRAAEKLVEQLATERVALNTQHFKAWSFIVGKMFESAQKTGLQGEEIRSLERMAAIQERAQKGQRLARGLTVDGESEDVIRAEAAADKRNLVDVFIDVVKAEVPDENAKDRIVRVLFERMLEAPRSEGV